MSVTSLRSELNNSIESIHYKPSCSKTTCILPCLGVSFLICFKVYLKAFRKKTFSMNTKDTNFKTYSVQNFV